MKSDASCTHVDGKFCPKCYHVEAPYLSSCCDNCGVLLENCKCVWKEVRYLYKMFGELSLRLDKNWDLSYKSDDNLSKRIVAIYETVEEMRDHDARINDLEKIGVEQRLIKLESDKLSQELDPKVWVHMNERVDKLESMTAMLDLQIKAKKFEVEMDRGNHYMECFSALIKKANDKIDNLEQLIYDRKDKRLSNVKPHKCPVCNGEGRVKLEKPLIKDNITYFSISCVPCKEQGIVWG